MKVYTVHCTHQGTYTLGRFYAHASILCTLMGADQNQGVATPRNPAILLDRDDILMRSYSESGSSQLYSTFVKVRNLLGTDLALIKTSAKVRSSHFLRHKYGPYLARSQRPFSIDWNIARNHDTSRKTEFNTICRDKIAFNRVRRVLFSYHAL